MGAFLLCFSSFCLNLRRKLLSFITVYPKVCWAICNLSGSPRAGLYCATSKARLLMSSFNEYVCNHLSCSIDKISAMVLSRLFVFSEKQPIPVTITAFSISTQYLRSTSDIGTRCSTCFMLGSINVFHSVSQVAVPTFPLWSPFFSATALLYVLPTAFECSLPALFRFPLRWPLHILLMCCCQCSAYRISVRCSLCTFHLLLMYIFHNPVHAVWPCAILWSRQ